MTADTCDARQPPLSLQPDGQCGAGASHGADLPGADYGPVRANSPAGAVTTSLHSGRPALGPGQLGGDSDKGSEQSYHTDADRPKGQVLTDARELQVLRPNPPLWNEWAQLDSETAYQAKVYYSNLAYEDGGARVRRGDYEHIHLEQMQGVHEDPHSDETDEEGGQRRRNPYYRARGPQMAGFDE